MIYFLTGIIFHTTTPSSVKEAIQSSIGSSQLFRIQINITQLVTKHSSKNERCAFTLQTNEEEVILLMLLP